MNPGTHWLEREGEIFRRYRVHTIHQANIQGNDHIHKAQIVEGLEGLNLAQYDGVHRL